MKKSDFVFNKESGRLSAGSEIAEAVILCKRPTSYPLANQTFLAQFQFSGEIEDLPTTEGTKIFIEIKENLILDPTLIQDSEGESNYAKGFGIGEIKAAQSWPTHDNYLKLYEIQGGQLIDLRKAISIPAVDEVAQRTGSLEEKITIAENKIEKLEEADGVDSFTIRNIFGDKSKDCSNFFENFGKTFPYTKKIRFTKIYHNSGGSTPTLYIQSLKVYDHLGILVDKNKYKNPPAYINAPNGGHHWLTQGATLEFKEYIRVLRVDLVAASHPNYQATHTPLIEAEILDGLFVPVFGAIKEPIGPLSFNLMVPHLGSYGMFVIQKAPIIPDCNIDLFVGDVEANKEIHIQVLGNGKIFSNLHLLAKKIGLPSTNLEVEIRRAVQVDVNKETCYWYGGEVIAQTSVAPGIITDQYSVVVAEFSSPVQTVVGERYIVAIKQQNGTVNSGNYYSICCDGSQFSTCFSAVKVNGSTRTQTKFMPFCSSEGFLKSAIVLKRKGFFPMISLGNHGAGTEGGNNIAFNCPCDDATITYIPSVSSYTSLSVEIIQNGKKIITGASGGSLVTLHAIGIKKGPATIKLGGYAGRANDIKIGIQENCKGRLFLPAQDSSYELGKKCSVFGYGYIDGELVGDTEGLSKSATTGEIPLGNAVGFFIKVLGNGKKVKVPYYYE